MCGLIAAFTGVKFEVEASKAALDVMQRRGPDGVDQWREDGVYLGHRRLAIIDQERRSSQPMQSICGRYVIVFNGEIYNYRSLREDLVAHGKKFYTSSDTEVLLALFAAEGESMLPKLRGMFAFVIWDRLERKAFAARDPYGIKPLYFSITSEGVLLASQVKALLATGLVDSTPDLHGQMGFWLLGSVPEPYTFYQHIRAVSAGNYLWIDQERQVQQRCWQELGAAWRDTDAADSAGLSPPEIQERVSLALRESVKRHLVSDVPVGVFLSGGIDSGALAGLMVEAGAQDLQGVTIAYDEFAGRHEDEAPVAAELARHYGIQHHVRRVCREEFIADLPRILAAMDQPSIDGINTWYASKAVSELGLKVVVSGVGGDELFLGYNSFAQLPWMVMAWRRLFHVPGISAVAARLARLQAKRSGNARWRHAPDWLKNIAGAWWLKRSCLAPESVTEIMGSEGANLLADFSPSGWVEAMSGTLAKELTIALAQIESTTYLRNQLLRDSDWASMDHSVELRTPLVDVHLLARLQSLLPHFHRFPGKTLLANAPSRPLPESIIRRPKTGFAIPVEEWAASALGTQRSWQATVALNAGRIVP